MRVILNSQGITTLTVIPYRQRVICLASGGILINKLHKDTADSYYYHHELRGAGYFLIRG